MTISHRPSCGAPSCDGYVHLGSAPEWCPKFVRDAAEAREWEAERRELRRREVAAIELAATSLQGLGSMLTVLHRRGSSEPPEHNYEPGRYGPWECKVCKLPLNHDIHRKRGAK